MVYLFDSLLKPKRRRSMSTSHGRHIRDAVMFFIPKRCCGFPPRVRFMSESSFATCSSRLRPLSSSSPSVSRPSGESTGQISDAIYYRVTMEPEDNYRLNWRIRTDRILRQQLAFPFLSRLLRQFKLYFSVNDNVNVQLTHTPGPSTCLFPHIGVPSLSTMGHNVLEGHHTNS